MKFILTRDVKVPERDLENAGIDCFVPNCSFNFIVDLRNKSNNLVFCKTQSEALEAALQRKTFMLDETIYIAPHEDIIIPSGIHSKFSNNLALIANNKSGIATKRKLDFGASVIDSGYQGEWHFNLVNRSNDYQKVSCGDKIIQFIPYIISTDPIEISNQHVGDFYADSNSKRGSGWAGSTGTK